jgi:hypothetical protein
MEPWSLTGMQVAIFDMMDPQARQDCLKEVKILQNLEHPNIVKCFNSFIQVRGKPGGQCIAPGPTPFPFLPDPRPVMDTHTCSPHAPPQYRTTS